MGPPDGDIHERRADAVRTGALPILDAHAGFRALRERYAGATRE